MVGNKTIYVTYVETLQLYFTTHKLGYCPKVPEGSFLNKVRALATLGFGSVQAYALRRRELAPTRKNWPQWP
jgi:hypothetical protein